MRESLCVAGTDGSESVMPMTPADAVSQVGGFGGLRVVLQSPSIAVDAAVVSSFPNSVR
ncbi:MAG TPA: hypothetical protein VK841_07805 [Polyangiaceae bacterium]|jgi:hypothetical protein|nr:hypothetical protein [Polyangiaceae bacterium]